MASSDEEMVQRIVSTTDEQLDRIEIPDDLMCALIIGTIDDERNFVHTIGTKGPGMTEPYQVYAMFRMAAHVIRTQFAPDLTPRRSANANQTGTR